MPKVPDRSIYDPTLDCYMHTGDNAVQQVIELVHTAAPNSLPIAMDTETPGVDDPFTTRCVTASWKRGDRTHAVLLDPLRFDGPGHRAAVESLVDTASTLIFHNAPFDVPALVHHELLSIADINKIVDTLVLARFGWPDQIHAKTLSALAKNLLGMGEFADGMKLAMKAAGYKTLAAGYRGMDIDSPIYRQGAMLDTVATLRIQPIIREHCWEYTLNHPFELCGASSLGEAQKVIEDVERVHRVMLRRTARGLAVDNDYLNEYTERVSQARGIAQAELGMVDLEGGKGKGVKILEYLEARGELPSNWPRTPKTGKLRAGKELLDQFDHPLVLAQRTLSDTDQVLGYLSTVESHVGATGRCHPQVGILGASQTGRMSATSPPYQQFSEHARPIFGADDGGLTSIDWSQIEPVTMGILAQDEGFLAPYERGDDLYEPLMRAAGIDRPTAKVVLLADMYGQGETGMAMRIGASIEQAGQIRRQIRAAMPLCTKWMAKVQALAYDYGKIVTAGKRILPVDQGGIFRAVNYMVQGSAADVLMHAICEMDKAGIGDHVYLAMHDELVVSTEVADEAQRIMLTPPPFFEYWLGRTPMLRGDRADMGAKWLKV